MEPSQLRELCDRALVAMYQCGMTEPMGMVDIDKLKKILGINSQEFDKLYWALHNRGYLDERGSVGTVSLSATGQWEAEHLAPRISLRPPPPAPAPSVAIYHGNTVVNPSSSVIQQAGSRAEQHASGSWNGRELLMVLAEIQRDLEKLELSGGDVTELREQLVTLREEVQALAKPSVIRSIGKAIIRLLQGAGEKLAVAGIVERLTKSLPG